MAEQIMWAVKTGFGRILTETLAPLAVKAKALATVHDSHARPWEEMHDDSGYRCIRVKVVEVE